jgi:NAD-dependent deacetylase
MRLVNIHDYLADPQVRVDAWRERLRHPAWTAEPNDGHRALAELQRLRPSVTLMTQNIDGLHQAAGATDVLELHGTIRECVCLSCWHRTPMQEQLDRVRAGDPDPACAVCGGIQRSATVAFGQQLDAAVLAAAVDAAHTCDLCLAVGTSLMVNPAAGLASQAKRQGAQLVIVNQGETGLDDVADEILQGRIGELLPRLLRSGDDGEEG